ncbi:LysM peptidoglycan-binding domain-containing protein [Paracidovorax avenae]|uniref:LysM peptidoglycan-binding domain-containing protein n=1 Tax=Paracidovorax avenae TaxID=80867 RepID=UPI001CEF6FFB|nr:LysM peptidoglycan-binding domain-containing protein [Paracidovorax avenae]
MRQDADCQVTTTTYQYTYLNGSWQQSAALTRRGGDVVGTITQRDANGFVVGIRQPKATGSVAQAPDGSLAAALTNQATQATSNDARYDRTFVNDANGTAVFVSQGGFNEKTEVQSSIANPASGYQGGVTGSALTPGHVQRQLVANGEVLARYGDAPTQEENTPQTNNPAYVDTADFRLQAAQIRPRHKSLDPVAYTVVGGETLKDIARNVLGDASLWWRIADANSLAVSGDGALTAGQTLTVPKLALNANSVETFQPYDPSQAMGSMDPVLPVPANGGGCGGIGAIIMIVIVVVVTIYTAGALSTVAGTATFGQTMAAGVATLSGAGTVAVGSAAASLGLGTAGAAAVAGAVGSIAGQFMGNLMGVQDGFNWKNVALSALGSGVTSGLGSTGWWSDPNNTFSNAAIKQAVSSTVSQGVGTVLGLQPRFDWKAVAAGAVGAGVGASVGDALKGNNAFGSWGSDYATGLARGTVSGFAGGLTTAVMRGGRISVQQVATDAFGNALGQSLAYSNGQALSSGTDTQTQENSLYSLEGSGGRGLGMRLAGGVGLSYAGLRASDSLTELDAAEDNGLSDLPRLDRFEAGPMVAGPGGAPSQLIKVGASAAWRGHQEAIYSALDDLNAAVSMGEQDSDRLAELRNAALNSLNYRRIAMQTDPAVMKEILDRGLTSTKDLEKLGMLGAFGDTDTVHRIAVATAQAGGAGNATGQGIASQLAQYEGFGPAYMSRMAGDVAVEAAAPGVYLNTLLGMRGHVDSTMLYVASMSGDEMEQLGRYTDTVMSQGGMPRYQDNEKLAGIFSGMQANGAGLARMDESFSVVGMGLRNFGASLGRSIGNMDPDILGNSTIGRMLGPVFSPMSGSRMYVVPPGQSAMAVAAARPTGATRNGVVRTNAADWRDLRDHWDDLGYSEILSQANRAAIAAGRTPKVDNDWVRVFPEDAGLIGERISMHHIGGLPVTIPLPATRHMDAHMPGGYRYNPGGPGSAAPFYK